MDLLIPDTWLRKYINTKAKPNEIAKYLSLCGPSIERVNKSEDGDYIYSIEVTTNRVDSASVLGIAREAYAILPRFGIKASLKNQSYQNLKGFKFSKKVKYLNTNIDPKLCPRFTAVLIKDVNIKKSPAEIVSLLQKVGVRPINNIVDITNFVMHETGQPVHAFDYDKIAGASMIVRESKRNEKIKTLDGKTFELPGGDIVIEDGDKRIIDLCGIMGGDNSAIDENTKNVLLFVQTYNPNNIRKTSMILNQRTEAAVLFEKGLDTEQVTEAIYYAISLMEKYSGGSSEKEILDIYPKPFKKKSFEISKNIIDKIIGIEIKQKDITTYLEALGFIVNWKENNFTVDVPSWRNNDINIPEDIAEEIARIYGYHNLPCVLMNGELPKTKPTNNFAYENNIRQILKALGGTEVYNLSLVRKDEAGTNALKLKNPLGTDTEYLRTSLMPSLMNNIKSNSQEKGDIHLFEIANCYIPRNNDLPEEKLVLSGVLRSHRSTKNAAYSRNKAIIKTLLDELKIDFTEKLEDGKHFLPNQRIILISNKTTFGEYGNLEVNLDSNKQDIFYYSFDILKLTNTKKVNKKYEEVSKYPPQVEDLTLTIPDRTYVGDIVELIKSTDRRILKIDLKDIYQKNYTFNIYYQDKNKTLTNIEVDEIRFKISKILKSKLGIIHN